MSPLSMHDFKMREEMKNMEATGRRIVLATEEYLEKELRAEMGEGGSGLGYDQRRNNDEFMPEPADYSDNSRR